MLRMFQRVAPAEMSQIQKQLMLLPLVAGTLPVVVLQILLRPLKKSYWLVRMLVVEVVVGLGEA